MYKIIAVDRTTMNSLKDAKDAMANVAIDYLQAYSQHLVSSQRGNSLLSPYSLRLIPIYILALMKNVLFFQLNYINFDILLKKNVCKIKIAFKFGSIRMDDRVYAMSLMKTMPLKYLMLCIYPHLYAIHNLDDKVCN
jgi:protein transport protein SEC24